MSDKQPFEPAIHMPRAEAETLRSAYRAARVIGEYGAGGSTAFAATECEAQLCSIESDREWVAQLDGWLRGQNVDMGRIDLQHCDIGPTKEWGRPVNNARWQHYWRYPYALWQNPAFNPDLVLIDGRFRIACMAACMLHCRQPLTVLIDDYMGRESYHVVEAIKPHTEIIGRMARFEIEPGQISQADFVKMVPWFFQMR